MNLHVNLQATSPKRRTADQAKQDSDNIVIRELTRKSPQKWSDLLKSTQISSRTLKKALNRLEEKGLLYRNVEQGVEYPPRVFYGLSPEGRKSSGPLLFSSKVYPYVLGLDLEWKLIHREGQEQPAAMIRFKSEKKSMRDRIALIGKRLGALRLFALLKAFEEGNLDWLHETEGFLNYDMFVAEALNFRKINQTSTSKIERVDGNTLTGIPQMTSMPEQKEIENLRSLLEKIYPEEIKVFEGILKNQKTKQIDNPR